MRGFGIFGVVVTGVLVAVTLITFGLAALNEDQPMVSYGCYSETVVYASGLCDSEAFTAKDDSNPFIAKPDKGNSKSKGNYVGPPICKKNCGPPIEYNPNNPNKLPPPPGTGPQCLDPDPIKPYCDSN